MESHSCIDVVMVNVYGECVMMVSFVVSGHCLCFMVMTMMLITSSRDAMLIRSDNSNRGQFVMLRL